jgi:hypothetical protein
MPLDPNIALSIKPVQIANPLEQYMQVQQIQQAQNQSRLADLMYGEKEREVSEGARLNDIYKGAVASDGTLDRTKLYSGVASAGLGSRLPGLQKNFAEADAKQADIGKIKAETHAKEVEAAHKAFDVAGQAFGYVRANPTLDNALAAIDYLGSQPGLYKPEQLESWRQQVRSDPSKIQSLADQAFRAALAAKDQLPKTETRNLGGTTDTISVDPVTGVVKTVNSVKNSVSPDAQLQANTSRANNRDTIAATKENQKAQYDAARGVLVDTRTGTATAVTGPDGKPLTRDKAMTEFQGKSAGFADRAQEADAILAQLHAKGPTGFGFVASDRPGAIKGAAESVPFIGEGLGGLVNTLPSALGGPNANQQRAEQAQRNFVNAILRQESGAAIGANEFENARKQYFPQPGDTPEVIAQKAANRRTAISGLARSAGGNYTPPAAGTPGAAPSSNGLPPGWSVEAH